MTFEQFNPDDLDEAELRAFARRARDIDERVSRAIEFFGPNAGQDAVGVYQSIGYYAAIKAKAMRDRAEGRIEEAQVLEVRLEAIYKGLPKWAKW